MTILEDVAVLLGRALTTDEATRATRLAEIAVATLEAELNGLTIAEGSETAVVFPGSPDVLWTPRYPVTDVTTLSVAGNVMTGFGWTANGCVSLGPVVIVNEWELNLTANTILPVEVTYSFGFADLPADVSGAIAQAVANVIRQQSSNASNVESKSIGDVSVTYGATAVQAAAAGVAAPMLAKSYRRIITSVPLVGAGTYPGGLQSQTSGGS